MALDRIGRWRPALVGIGLVLGAGLAAGDAQAQAERRTNRIVQPTWQTRQATDQTTLTRRQLEAPTRPSTVRPGPVPEPLPAAAPQTGTGGASMPVPQGPPLARFEPQPPTPSSMNDPVWQSGRWQRLAGEWFWQPGRYVERPDPFVAWIRGRWDERPWGWVFTPGRWVPLEDLAPGDAAF